MKAYTFTTRNVTASERNAAGDLFLHHLGDVTCTVEGMTRAEVAEWEWATDALNTRGIDEETFRLTVNGWKVVHPEAGVVGLLFRGAGSRVHVEWYDPANDEYFSAGWARTLAQGTAWVVNARQQAGHGLPVDVEPEPCVAPQPTAPVRLENGTRVHYHGTFAMTFSDLGIPLRVYACDYGDCDCDAYELRDAWNQAVVLHVALDHVTALDTEPAAA